ncbi:MAG: hydroxylamine reductase [Mobilitalea sp.]
MQNQMFCYQCEQTAGGKGCTQRGVCGKTPVIAALQDLLVYQAKGIALYGNELLKRNQSVPENYIRFIEDALFTTLTNVNFNEEQHLAMLKQSQKLKDEIKAEARKNLTAHEATYRLGTSREEILEDARMAGIMFDQSLDDDIRSVRETIKYGLKGMAAYTHQARAINYSDPDVDHFYVKALAAITDEALDLDDLVTLMLETGKMAVGSMAILDKANNEHFTSPSPHMVNIRRRKGPFIVVSGHDLYDLELLLEQTQGKGVNIYTHGEMLPSHGYEALKKYPHLVGNFGTAWQNQQKEFDNLPGCILMTTNCLMTPHDSYKDRLFTTSVVGFDDIAHIHRQKDNTKDFSSIIEKAIELGGFAEDENPKEITVGFGHNAILSNAEAIITSVKNGDIRRFFLIGGCDGARPGRNYYTEFAQSLPKDCIILTLACGKYRFNYFEFGKVAGLPRLLDVGQCNDAYSAVRVAMALSEAFQCDINDLPLSLIISWYEQKAVAVLLALLYLDVKNIHLGPTLPAFLSPNVLQLLVNKYKLKHITTPSEDLNAIFATV